MKAALLALALANGPIQEELRLEASEHKVPYEVAAAVVCLESGWKVGAVGVNANSLDIGLMQLNNKYFYDGGEWRRNIHIGVSHLSYLFGKTCSWYGALVGYNGGERSYWGSTVPKSHQYAVKVLLWSRQIRHAILREGWIKENAL